MLTESITGTTKINGEDVEYEGTLYLPETVEEYEDWSTEVVNGKPRRGEDAAQNILKAVADYERRRQRAELRPTKSGGTGVRKVMSAVNAKLKSGEISQEDFEAAFGQLGIEL